MRLNLRDVLYNRRAANVFLAFLISRRRYQEVALWMDVHYVIFSQIKDSGYPSNIAFVLEEIMRNPSLKKTDKAVRAVVSSDHRTHSTTRFPTSL